MFRCGLIVAVLLASGSVADAGGFVVRQRVIAPAVVAPVVVRQRIIQPRVIRQNVVVAAPVQQVVAPVFVPSAAIYAPQQQFLVAPQFQTFGGCPPQQLVVPRSQLFFSPY